MKPEDQVQLILEEVREQYKTIVELVKDVPEIKERVNRLEENMDGVKTDLTEIKEILKIHSREIADLKAKS